LVVEILEPLEPPGADDPEGVNRLLRQARMAMLVTLGEPDLEQDVSREP
jgi:hypothetical protein